MKLRFLISILSVGVLSGCAHKAKHYDRYDTTTINAKHEEPLAGLDLVRVAASEQDEDLQEDARGGPDADGRVLLVHRQSVCSQKEVDGNGQRGDLPER